MGMSAIAYPHTHTHTNILMCMTLFIFQQQSSIKYEMDELPACKSLLDQCAQDDLETLINYAAISYKEVGGSERERERE